MIRPRKETHRKLEPRTSDNPQWPFQFRPTENGHPYLLEIAWLNLRTYGVIHPLYMLDGTCPTVLSTSFRIMAAVHGSEGKRTMFSEQHTTRNDSYLILLLELDSSERSNVVCSAPFSVLFWDRSRLSALADTGRHRPVLWFSRQNSTIASCFPGGVSSLKTRMDIRNSVDGTEPPTSTYVSFYCTRFRCEGEHLFSSHPLSCLSTSRKEVKRSRRRSASHTPL